MKPRKVKFPFKSRLSLKPLLDFWERLLAEGKCGMKSLGPVIRQKLEYAPELRQPIEDLTILELAVSSANFRGIQARVKYAEAFQSIRLLINI